MKKKNKTKYFGATILSDVGEFFIILCIFVRQEKTCKEYRYQAVAVYKCLCSWLSLYWHLKISCQHMWNLYTVCVCAYLKHHIYTRWWLIMERGDYDYRRVSGIRNLFPLKVGEKLRTRFRHTMSKSDLYFELPPLHHRVLATLSSKYMMLLPDFL